MNIFIRAYKKQGYNGDRAEAMGMARKTYYDYEVICTKGSKEVVLNKFDGYDSWNSHVLPDQLKYAQVYVLKVSVALDLEIGEVEYMEKKSVETWIKKSS